MTVTDKRFKVTLVHSFRHAYVWISKKSKPAKGVKHKVNELDGTWYETRCPLYEDVSDSADRLIDLDIYDTPQVIAKYLSN